MAYDIHPSFYENKSLREAIFLQRHIRYSVCKYRSFVRRAISTVKSNSVDCKTSNITVSQSFDLMEEYYQKKGYAFCEDVFNILFHKEIIDHWPSKVYFNPPSSRDKFFNTGFGMSPFKEGVSSFKDYDYPWQGRKYFHKDFYHGFKKIDRRKFRWAFSCAFFPK